MHSKLNLSQIVVNPDYLARNEINEDIVSDYLERFHQGITFAPITVIKIGEDHFLASGLHRFEVYRRAEQKTIDAIIKSGDYTDIILESISSNIEHGLRFNNAEKARCVTLVLKQDDWRNWSDNYIAKTCGVSNHFVKKIRAKESSNNSQATKSFIRNGQVHTMNTSKIGSSSPVKVKMTNLQAQLNSSLSHIIQVIKLYKSTYTDPKVSIPKEFEDEIKAFVDWFQKRGA